MITDEENLLKKSKSGDVAAFEELMDGYQKKIFNIALRMIGNHEDASELAQEVLIKIYKSIRSFKEEAAFSTWIYRITTNVCLDELRKRKNRTMISINEEIAVGDGEVSLQIADHGPTPEEILEQKETRKIIENAIGKLSPEHRTVIILRELQNLDYEEISEITKVPVGTVKSRINRARQELRNILKNKRELFYGDFVKINSKEESI